MNNLNLIGRLVRDVELKVLKNSDNHVVSFTIAVDNYISKEEGKTTSFIPCVAFSKNAEIIAKYVKKGDLVALSGRLNQRSYKDKSDKTINVVEVIVTNVDLIQPKKPTNKSDEEDQEIPF